VQCFELAEIKRLRGELAWKGKLIMLMGGGESNPLTTDAGLAELAKIVDGIGPPIGSYVTGKSPAGRKVTDLAARARKAGLLSHPYTLRADELPKCVTSVDELLRVLFDEAKVDGLFTDFPDLCIKK
jgi:glycerophosphoryl diester phosphodiesterase